jgi:hypothetical protein
VNWRPIVLVVVIVGLIAVGVYFVRKGASLPEGYQFEERATLEGETAAPGVPTAPVAPGVATTTAPGPRPDIQGMLKEEKPFKYSSKNIRNPMAPLLAKPEKVAVMPQATRRDSSSTIAHRLMGIMWSPAKPLAIIDGNVMAVGEKLRDGSVVAEIGRDSVALKRDGKMFRLVLK